MNAMRVDAIKTQGDKTDAEKKIMTNFNKLFVIFLS